MCVCDSMCVGVDGCVLNLDVHIREVTLSDYVYLPGWSRGCVHSGGAHN